MTRSIAEINKAIDDKQKLLDKTVKDGPKLQKEIEALATEQQALEKKVKAEKEKKAKAGLEKEMDEVIKKYGAAKTKQRTMETAEGTLAKAVETLRTELENTKEGIAKYGKARALGIAMLEKEGKKLKAYWEKAKEYAEEAEECSRRAEASAKKGDVDSGQGAKQIANNALMAAVTTERNAKALIDEITTMMTSTQRNLKAKDFDVVDGDVLVHNKLTKQVQDDFKELEAMAAECIDFRKTAEKAAAEAAEFADASSVGLELYEQILDKAMTRALEQAKQVNDALSSKWGGYITERGVIFTRLLQMFQAKPNDAGARSAVDKTLEQGQTFLATSKKKIDDQIKQLIDDNKKATDRIPGEYQRALKSKSDKLNMMSIQMLTFHKKVKENYDATIVEFDKLKDAVA